MSDSGRAVGVRRVSDPPGPDDGYRVLVDRIWPRGLTKAAAAVDEWCRDIAPSTELRHWYGHDPDLFPPSGSATSASSRTPRTSRH